MLLKMLSFNSAIKDPGLGRVAVESTSPEDAPCRSETSVEYSFGANFANFLHFSCLCIYIRAGGWHPILDLLSRN